MTNVIKIMGGLGNQLFQYALGKAQMNNGIDVYFDLSFYGNRTKPPMRYEQWPRYYRLDKFNTVVREKPMIHSVVVNEVSVGFDLSILNKRGCGFMGYWQYPAYYNAIIPGLRQDFTLKEEFYTEEFLSLKQHIEDSNSVGVHVRRGDYVFQKGFWNLPFDYYLRAIKRTDGDLFVFSDDIPWCKSRFKKEYFPSRKLIFVAMEDYLTFELLRLCKQKVISNSTFSWWTAYLNEDHQKVIAPSGWTTGSRELNHREEMEDADRTYYPEHWIKI